MAVPARPVSPVPSRRRRAGRSVLAAAVVVVLVAGALSACTSSKQQHAPDTRRAVLGDVVVPTVVGPSGAEVTAAATGGATSVVGHVTGADITLRRSGSTWSTRLAPGRPFVTGLNRLSLQARGAGRSSTPVIRPVYVLGESGDFGLTLTRAADPGAVQIAIGIASAASAVTLTVNRTDESGLLGAPTVRASAQVTLGANDGLRPGANTVEATAVDDAGRWQRASLGITLGSSVPLAEAGRDVSDTVGHVTTLDASGSRPAARETLTYDWSVVRAPAGSRAVLVHADSEHPTFTPDVAGSYRFRVTVTGPGGTSSDEVTLTGAMAVPPIGAYLQTRAIGTDGAVHLDLAGTSLASVSASALGVSMLAVLDRQTLGTVSASTSTDAATELVDADAVLPPDPDHVGGKIAVLSVAAGPAGPQPLVTALGVTPDTTMLSGKAFSVVVLTQGSMTATGQTPSSIVWRSTAATAGNAATSVVPATGAGSIDGYLQLNHTTALPPYSPFNFQPVWDAAFDTSSASTATTNTMQFGCQAASTCQDVTSAPLAAGGCASPGATGGFQVVVLTAATVAPTVVDATTVTTDDGCTADTDAQATVAALARLTTFLAAYPANQDGGTDHLVAVQSIGTPRPTGAPAQDIAWATAEQAWLQFGQVLVAYGASTSVFADVGSHATQGYALLGTTSTTLPGSDSAFGVEYSADDPSYLDAPSPPTTVASVSGVLHRDHRLDLAPAVRTVGNGDAQLEVALYQPPTAAESTPGEQAALDYLTQHATDLGLPDPSTTGGACDDPAAPSFRQVFCAENTTTVAGANALAGQLRSVGATPPAGAPTEVRDNWQTVTGELATEVVLVPDAALLGRYLQAPFGATASDGLVDYANVTAAIKKAFGSTDTVSHHYGASTWISLAAYLVGALASVCAGCEPAVAAVLGLVSAGLSIWSLFADTGGHPAVTQPPVDSDASDLLTQLQYTYDNTSVSLGYLLDMLVTNPRTLALAGAVGKQIGAEDNGTLAAAQFTSATTTWLTSHLLGGLFTPVALSVPRPDGHPTSLPATGPWQGDASTFLCNGRTPFTTLPDVDQQYRGRAVSTVSPTPLPVTYVLAQQKAALDRGNVVLAPPSALALLDSTTSKAYVWEQVLGATPGSSQTCTPAEQNAAGGPTVDGQLAGVAADASGQTIFTISQQNVVGYHLARIMPYWQTLQALPVPADKGSPLAAATGGTGDVTVFYLSKGHIVGYSATLDRAKQVTNWVALPALPGSVSPDRGSGLAAASPSPGSYDVFFSEQGTVSSERYTPQIGPVAGHWAAQPTQLPSSGSEGQEFAATVDSAGNEHVIYPGYDYTGYGHVTSVDRAAGASTWTGPTRLPGIADSGTQLAASSFGAGDEHIFFTRGGTIVNTYLTLGHPPGGPGGIGSVTGSNGAGLAAAAAPGGLAPLVVANLNHVLYQSTLTSTGWSQFTPFSAAPFWYWNSF